MNDAMSRDLVRGHIDTMILRVLIEHDNYGYEIIKAIGTISGGLYELREPSLYTSLKRLEKARFIQSYWGDESQGGRRKYYKITPLGRTSYDKSVAAWKKAKTLISRLIEGGVNHE
ncbi:MAG: PadR family transcriptional regulator [Peptococcaceae bacterium]|nr:PadR family transcriptional regulator [Peptococcaceae bacterium]MDR2737177.1 PadR family transcriptional regulator [Gracilibacteraceae bacterium]